MTKNKLQKFAELLSFPHVYENFDPEDPKLLVSFGKEVEMKKGWNDYHFKNQNPLVVELACGRGEYTIGLAERHKNKNFIGVDIKGARIWKGAKYSLENKLQNVAFLRTRIEQLHHFFTGKEIDEIWITFPDPFLKKENRRLTAPRFLRMYHPLVKDSGIIYLKTDSLELYEFTLAVLEENKQWALEEHSPDIYSQNLPNPDLDIKTYYENMHLNKGKKITYIKICKVDS